jgi:hypothetical protein
VASGLRAQGVHARMVLLRFVNVLRKPGPIFNFITQAAWDDGRPRALRKLERERERARESESEREREREMDKEATLVDDLSKRPHALVGFVGERRVESFMCQVTGARGGQGRTTCTG